MFNTKISRNNYKIYGELVVDSYFFDSSRYEYAFYLRLDDEILEKRWYEEGMKVEFEIPNSKGVAKIQAFIRDKDIKNVRHFMSEELVIQH